MHFGWGLFCCSNFIFFYIDDKEKTNLTSRSSHSNLLILKIYNYYNFKQNKARAYRNFIEKLFHLEEVAESVVISNHGLVDPDPRQTKTRESRWTIE